MTVRELVGGEVVSTAPTASLRVAAEMMMSTGAGSVVVAVDGALRGILTERDLVGAIVDDVDFDKAPVSDWMSGYPDSFSPDMSVAEAADWMLAAGYRHLPVVEGNKVLGVISIKDVLWALTEGSQV